MQRVHAAACTRAYTRRGAVDASDYKTSIRLQDKLQIQDKHPTTRQASDYKRSIRLQEKLQIQKKATDEKSGMCSSFCVLRHLYDRFGQCR